RAMRAIGDSVTSRMCACSLTMYLTLGKARHEPAQGSSFRAGDLRSPRCPWLAQHRRRRRALRPHLWPLSVPDLLAWIEATQPDSWQRLARTHGAAAGERIAERVRKNLNERGTLDQRRPQSRPQGA